MNTLRFGIRNSKNKRAATWKLWTVKNHTDVYLSCRELNGQLKASLHESGEWHIGFEKKFFKERIENIIPLKNRFIDEWLLPEPIAPGIILAFRILTPDSSITSNISDLKDIRFVDFNGKNKAIEFYIIITIKGVDATNWPGKNGMGTSLIGSISLVNGDIVWGVYKEIDMPIFPAMTNLKGLFFKGADSSKLQGNNLRALVFGQHDDGTRIVYDCAVLKKNNN